MGSLATPEGRFRDPAVPSVDRALNLLELLASTNDGLNLSTISRKLHIPKSSAYYLVSTLAKRNFIRRSADRRFYLLGSRVPPFATINPAELELTRICSPHLQSLSKRLTMTAQIGVLEGAEARIVDRSELPGPRLDSWVGRHFDLHCTAIGKALISDLPDEEAEALFKPRGLPKHNVNTISSLEVLKFQLAETRRRGFAMDDEEHELGVRCLASPVFNHLGGVVAAVCVFTPVHRLPGAEVPRVGAEVLNAAREISRNLSDSALDVQRIYERWEVANRPAPGAR